MSRQEAPVSHGRGGQGNIGPNSSTYIDGEITRQGPTGNQGDGAYSTGRGGTGNIGSPHIKADKHGHDHEVVPLAATRIDKQESHHYGRGGAGNIEHFHPEKKDHQHDGHGNEQNEGLADKLKLKAFTENHGKDESYDRKEAS